MNDVIIKQVEEYDPGSLKTAVHKILSAMPDLTALFGRRETPRLVVIKPNWIQESHQLNPQAWEQVITHPQLLLAIVEELAPLMSEGSTVCVCDAPHTSADFQAIIARGGFKDRFDQLQQRFRHLKFEILDLRRERWIVKDDVIVDRIPVSADPRGYVRVDLGHHSMLHGHPGEGKFYGADYDAAEVNDHHSAGKHEYLIAGTPMRCDLLINVPKLKTHKKTGITCALKNLVGINGNKNWLPHFVQGTPRDGGDEFAETTWFRNLESRLKRMGQTIALRVPRFGPFIYRFARSGALSVFGSSQESIRAGNWIGNDTCWRMVLDLNRALFYATDHGELRPSRTARHYLVIVDGIVGGEGDGPLAPDPVQSNVILAGSDPAAIDAVAAKLMGFSIEKLPLVRQAFAPHPLPISSASLGDIRLIDPSNNILKLAELKPLVDRGFRPHMGWLDLNPNFC